MKKLIFILLGFITAHAWGAEIQISLEKNKVALGEPVNLEIVVTGSGAGGGEPKIVIPRELSVISQGKSQKVEIVNWQMSSSVIYTLTLSANKEGVYTLGPAQLESGGQTIPSNKVELEVSPQKSAAVPGTPQGVLQPFAQPLFRRSLQDMLQERRDQKPSAGNGAAPSQSRKTPRSSKSEPQAPPLAFIESQADKKTVYTGEPVKFAVLFYTRVPFISQPQYTPPATSGFWREELPQRSYNATVQGASYQVTELPLILFPSSAGDLQIGEAKIAVELEKIDRGGFSDPFDPNFLQQFFGLGASETKILATKPINIKAWPLPAEGRPADFSGAVGEYSIEAKLDKTNIKVGETLTLSVTITGEGNIKGLPGPKYPNLDGIFRSYETETAETISKQSASITGQKTFKMLLIPQIPGQPNLTVPPINFTYFNPKTKTYVRKATQPLSVVVTGEPLTRATAAAPGKKTKELASDISYIITKMPSENLRQKTALQLSRHWIFLGSGPMLLWAAGGLFIVFKKRHLAQRARPLEKFTQAIIQAQKLARRGQIQQVAHLLGTAFEKTLIELLGLSPAEATIKSILSVMAEKTQGKITPQEVEYIKEILQHLDFLRYAPGQQAEGEKLLQEILRQAQRVRKILEKL